MDINSLAQQYSGRKFGELILHEYKKLDFQTVSLAVLGTIDELPESISSLMESWLDEIGQYGVDPFFWQRDCGEVFIEICDRARQNLEKNSLPVTDDHLFNMFQVIVLNFVYSLHKNPASKAFVQKSIGIGFLRRLFM